MSDFVAWVVMWGTATGDLLWPIMQEFWWLSLALVCAAAMLAFRKPR
jgi:hypothetical protein